jgi:GNAT superfamily N-acetyltransferase
LPADLSLSFRLATRSDVLDIVRMLADDPLGAKREAFTSPLPTSYYAAFDAADQDPNNELVVAILGDRVVGVLQMTFIPYLTYRGGWRASIEGVRVDSSVRSGGIGKRLFEWAIERARERGCHLVNSRRIRRAPMRFVSTRLSGSWHLTKA